MFTDQDLRELLAFKAEHPVLSIYLDTEPTQGNADAYRLRLRNLLKEVNLPEDVTAVEHYINQQYDWHGRGVAIFSCAPEGFFKAFSLALPVRDFIYVENQPLIHPLAALMDNYGGYGVALVDKQGARLFYFHLGELREQEGVLGEEVKQVKRGGASAVPGRRGGTAGQSRYVDEVVERNMKETADFAIHFFEENHVRRVVIGGTEDNISQFRSQLPKAWQSLVVGTLSIPMTASHSEVLEKAIMIGLEAEQKHESRLVESIIASASRGNGGVTGLENTMEAVNAGRVQTLVVHDGFHKVGQMCPACGWIAVQKTEVCPQCSGDLEPAQDVIDLAVTAVMRHGGAVEIARANPVLEKIGKIGAALRY